MPRVVVVPNGRERQVMVWLTWEELNSLSPGATVSATGGELRVHTGDHADQWWQFCEELGTPGAYRVVIPTDAVDRLKRYRKLGPNAGDFRPVLDASFHAIGWRPGDLCKCGEPKVAEQAGCGHCLTKYDKPINDPPLAFSDTVTFSVIGKPDRPENPETALVLPDAA